MLGEPLLQPTHARCRKFGNRIIGTARLRAHHRDRIAGPARSRLLTLQHRDRPAPAGELASEARTGNTCADDDDG